MLLTDLLSFLKSRAFWFAVAVIALLIIAQGCTNIQG
jgi:hypothetical protein